MWKNIEWIKSYDRKRYFVNSASPYIKHREISGKFWRKTDIFSLDLVQLTWNLVCTYELMVFIDSNPNLGYTCKKIEFWGFNRQILAFFQKKGFHKFRTKLDIPQMKMVRLTWNLFQSKFLIVSKKLSYEFLKFSF